MDNNINLLTREEKVEQFKGKAVKTSSILSVILLIIVGGLSAYFYIKVSTLKGNIKAEEQKIEEHRAKINSMESIEVIARNLYQKYTILSEFLHSFNAKVPEGLEITLFRLAGQNELSVLGTADNYLLVSDFLANINNAGEDSVFESAYLESVKLNPHDSTVDYAVTIFYDPEGLTHAGE
jgi:Tfp pilus assembly protein PilN